MTRSDLYQKVAELQDGLTQRDVRMGIDKILSTIVTSLKAGERVELRGFGSFELRQRKEYTGRNPSTGKPVIVPSRIVPHFKSGHSLRQRVNK